MRAARLIRLAWRRWWQQEQLASASAWTMHGLLAIAVFSMLVAGLNQLEEHARGAPPAAPQEDVTGGANELDPLIARTAAKIMPPGWDWRLLKAMIRKESNYNPKAQSPGGAVGLCQMLPATARHLGLTPGQFFDAKANLEAGTRYLRDMYDRHFEVPDRAPDWERTRIAIACYNAGPGRVRQAIKAGGGKRWRQIAPHLPESTIHHIEKIVEDFYPSFSQLKQSAGRPPIGNWKPRLRFWRPDEL